MITVKQMQGAVMLSQHHTYSQASLVLNDKQRVTDMHKPSAMSYSNFEPIIASQSIILSIFNCTTNAVHRFL